MKRFFPSSDSSDGEDLKRSVAPGSRGVTRESKAAAPQSPLRETPQKLPRPSRHGMQRCSWRTDLQGLLDAERAQLGSQRRRLVLHTLFSGMGSPEQALSDLGFSVDCVVACEKKAHGRAFCVQNSLAPTKHYFIDAEPLVASGHAPCSAHLGETCGLPGEQPDLLVAGFPCTPFSRMRQGVAGIHDAESHKDFDKVSWTVQYIARTRPRIFVLENVPAFAGVPEASGMPRTHNFAEDMCGDLRKLGYDVAWVLLSLGVWVQARSRRIFICGVDASLGTGFAESACSMARDLEARRGAEPPVPWSDFLFDRGSESWMLELGHWPECEADAPSEVGHKRGNGDDAAELGAKWEQQAVEFRMRLRRAGRTFHDKRPWSQGPCARLLMGIPRPIPARKWELLDLGVLWAMDQTGKEMDHCINELLCETTQNPSRTPWSFDLKRLCRHSRPYSYKHDRLLTPGELFGIYGWERPCLEHLSRTECCDLLGDSMALPTIAVAMASVIYTVGRGIPTLWPEHNGDDASGLVANQL